MYICIPIYLPTMSSLKKTCLDFPGYIGLSIMHLLRPWTPRNTKKTVKLIMLLGFRMSLFCSIYLSRFSGALFRCAPVLEYIDHNLVSLQSILIAFWLEGSCYELFWFQNLRMNTNWTQTTALRLIFNCFSYWE